MHPGALSIETRSFEHREAARAVVLDSRGGIFLLNVSRHHYHKLPGGGIDEGEDIQTALARELLEEIGCKAKTLHEIGIIIEYRDKHRLKQTSYCFLAQQIGTQQPTSMDDGEIADGFQEVRAAHIDDAIRLLEKDTPDDYEGEFIKMRDLAFLRAARQLL